ncbi:MAG: DUF86 domain-containing protein [Magnetospirillum sp.]|nr:DUF86 domain-containing protein [Magnetospirillum sp.]
MSSSTTDNSNGGTRSAASWCAIAGIRDRIVHEYFRTNTRRIWDVVQDDLGPLETALKSALKDRPNP